ncbi:MAG TPA: diacylglycerol kinase family protein [Burkholderiales bacterium]|nr:diacylglycerol kinase family protein [Burkholderiales bacterium]
MRVTLIHNPGAGKQDKRNRDDLVNLLRDFGHEASYQSSKDDGWVRALENPGELVVVAGGDGTVSRIAKRIVGRGVPIAVLPSGTANNISRSLGLVDRPFEELVRSWPQARRVKLDVGVAEGPWGIHYFLEGIGAGLFARLLASGSGDAIKRSKTKRPAAKVDNALERLKKLAEKSKPLALKAELDGKDLSGKYLLLEAVNLPYVGPNLFLAPDSKPGDGQLDVVLVGEAERDRLVKYLETWQENRERLAVLPSHRGKRLTMEWTGFEVHIDDELWPAEDEKPAAPPARIEARLEGDVEFLVPPKG